MYLLVIRSYGEDDCYICFNNVLDLKMAKKILEEQEELFSNDNEELLLEIVERKWKDAGIEYSYFEDEDYYFVG